jgi:soluble lytic murein transglycosylase-like protein
MAKNPNIAVYRALASEAEARYGIPAGTMAGLIEQESSWSPKATSKAGAVGLTQIVPKWHPTVDAARLSKDPAYSIDQGARILSERIKARRGNLPLALADYNGGQGNVDKWLRGATQLPKETADYVPKVLGRAQKYGAQPMSMGDMAALTAQLGTKTQPDKLLKAAGVLGKINPSDVAAAAFTAAGLQAPDPTEPTYAQFAAQPMPDPVQAAAPAFDPLAPMPQNSFSAEPDPAPQPVDIFSFMPQQGMTQEKGIDFGGLRAQADRAFESSTEAELSPALDKYLSTLI